MSTSQTGLELTLWKEIVGLNLSPSHDRWHVDRVLAFANQLQQIYGGDPEVLLAAVLMHDLGRSDRARAHQEDSRRASAEMASAILEAMNYPIHKRTHVLTAILEHDQPGIRPSSIEGRILKDADFLAGFGAWGILRIAMWSGESNRKIGTLVNRISEGMERRFENLEFPESAQVAQREMLFARLFLESLQKPALLLPEKRKGRYIVLEGISASGKDTQAEYLRQNLERAGFSVVQVKEPTDEPDSVFHKWKELWLFWNSCG